MSISDTQQRSALQDVLLNYAAAVDERDPARYRACFTEDVAVFGFGTETLQGRDAWVDYVWAALEKYTATQHLLGPMFATIDGDSAQTRSDVQGLHFLEDGSRFTLWATYHSSMRREDGQWRIYRHELQVRGSATSN